MKKKAPSPIVPIAAVFAAFAALGAGKPDLAVAGGSLEGASSGVRAAATRGSAGAALQDQSKASQNPPVAGTGDIKVGPTLGVDVSEKFSFIQPEKTRRIFVLNQRQINELNRLGQQYVDLIDDGTRFEENRARLDRDLYEKRSAALEEAGRIWAEAKSEMLKAKGDLAVALRGKLDAEAAIKECDKNLEAIDRELGRIEERAKRNASDAAIKTKVVKKLEDRERALRATAGEAEKRLGMAEAAAKDAKKSVNDAEKAVSGAEKAAKAARTTAADAANKDRAAAQAAATDEAARTQAEADLSAASRALVAAKDAVRRAERDLSRAKKAADKAARSANEADSAAKAARKKADADKVVDPKTLGFWARRSFDPTRSAKRAEEAEKEALLANAEAEKAVRKVSAAQSDAAEQARKEGEAQAAVDMLKQTFGKTVDAAEKARKAAKEAHKAAVAAERDRQEKESRLSEAQSALLEVRSRVPKADERVVSAKKAFEEAGAAASEVAARRDEAAKATDPIAIAQAGVFDERNAEESKKGAVLEKRKEAEGRLAEAEKIDVSVQNAVLKKATEACEAAERAYKERAKPLAGVSHEASLGAARMEKELEKRLDDIRDAIFQEYRTFGAPNDDFEKRKKDADAALEDARGRFKKAEADAEAKNRAVAQRKKALADARTALKNAAPDARAAAKEALDGAKSTLAAAEREASEATGLARREKAALERSERTFKEANGALQNARTDLKDAVDAIEKDFRKQVAAAQDRKRRVLDLQTMSEGERRRAKAREAKEAFRKAADDFQTAKREWDEANAGSWLGEERFRAVCDKYAAARSAFTKAEDEYQKYFGDQNTFKTLPMTLDEANDLYESNRTKADLHGFVVRGDRRWLAATSVNGEGLLETFRDEMALACYRDATTIEWDKTEGYVRIVAPADKVRAAAEKAAIAVRRRAIYGGFYFAGLDVDPGKEEVFVDKGRYGPFRVAFVRDEDAPPDVEAGRLFDADDILAKLGADAAENPVREGEAFNFAQFRKNLTALNANPDIRRVDVEFTPDIGEFDYGYEEEDDGMGTNRNTRAVMTQLTVRERPFPAPIHGVIGIDNFNSMGDSDRIAGEADTWMARATLQHLDLWGLGHALTLSGNYSLGGSLYGGAASYYIPREADSTWGGGSWRRASGWSWTVHGGYTDVEQEEVVPDLDVLGTGYYAGVSASSRIADFGGSVLDFSLGFTWRYVESSIRVGGQEIAMGPDNGDGYTLMPLSAALLYADKDLDDRGLFGFIGSRGRTFATAELAYNLGGSTVDDLRSFRYAIDDDRYLVARLQLARLQLLWEDWQSAPFFLPRVLFLKGDAQWASTPVIGAEQFGLGGHGTVRGYVERQFMGDTGAAGTIELRTPIGLGWLDASAPDPYLASDRLQLVYFLDAGWFTLEDGLGSGENDSEFIASLGLGFRFSWDDLVFRFDWGYPLVTDDAKFESSSAGVIHASMQYQF